MKKKSPRRFKPFPPPLPQKTKEEMEAERIQFEQDQLAKFGARPKMRRDYSFGEVVNKPENQQAINQDKENLVNFAKAGGFQNPEIGKTKPMEEATKKPDVTSKYSSNLFDIFKPATEPSAESLEEKIRKEKEFVAKQTEISEKEAKEFSKSQTEKKRKETSLINLSEGSSTSDDQLKTFHEEKDDEWLTGTTDKNLNWFDDDGDEEDLLPVDENLPQLDENKVTIEDLGPDDNDDDQFGEKDEATEKKFIIQTMKGPIDLEELDQISHQNHMISLKSQYTRLKNVFIANLNFINAPVKSCYQFIKKCEALINKSETFALFK